MRIKLLAIALVSGALHRFRERRAMLYPTTMWRNNDAQVGNWPDTGLRRVPGDAPQKRLRPTGQDALELRLLPKFPRFTLEVLNSIPVQPCKPKTITNAEPYVKTTTRCVVIVSQLAPARSLPSVVIAVHVESLHYASIERNTSSGSICWGPLACTIDTNQEGALGTNLGICSPSI